MYKLPVKNIQEYFMIDLFKVVILLCQTVLLPMATSKGACKEIKFKKSEITLLYLSGWVGPGLTRNFFLFGKYP